MQIANETKPIAWGAFHVGGPRDGKLYSHADTEAQIDTYILDVHRSSDSITLRKAPLYTADPALRVLLADILPALIRLGDFVGNVDKGGASGMGVIDRCALVLRVTEAMRAAEGGQQ